MRISNPDKLRSLLVEAATHARSVVARDKVVPTEIMRRGEFITQLRRALNHQYGCGTSENRELTSFLCDKGIWKDILQLNGSRYSVTEDRYNELRHIVSLAREDMSVINPLTLEESLSEIEKDVKESDSFIERARVLNREADAIFDDFLKLAADIS